MNGSAPGKIPVGIRDFAPYEPSQHQGGGYRLRAGGFAHTVQERGHSRLLANGRRLSRHRFGSPTTTPGTCWAKRMPAARSPAWR